MFPVSIIEPVGGHGGMDYYDFGLASGLFESGCDVVIYTCDETGDGSGKVVCKKNFRKIYGKDHHVKRAFRYVKGLLDSLIDSKRRRVKVIHLHYFHTGIMELITAFLCKLFIFKVVVTIHDVESFSGGGDGGVGRLIFKFIDGVIVHNKSSYSEIKGKEFFKGKDAYIIPHGNYDASYGFLPSKAEARSRLDIPADRKVLLFFGQIKKVKGLDVLLKSIPKIIEEHPNILLLIAGKVWKDDFSKYQELINSLDVSESIKLDIRYISDEEALCYYSSCDMVVLPYNKIYQSGVLLMAMSFGKLVVVSDLPGMLDVVEHNETGIVFRRGDSADLAKVVNASLHNPDACKIADKGRDLMLSKFDWRVIGGDTFSVYMDVLNDK